jgi:hypothetical protein
MAIYQDAARPVASGWLRGRQFDLGFVAGTALLALGAGGAVLFDPRLFGLVLVADLWLLGYHHVIATFTRLCFDLASVRRHWFLLFGLPPIVLAAVALMLATAGAWVVVTVYFYWQWFHYMRQSWGVTRAYGRSAGPQALGLDGIEIFAFHAVPIFGMLWRSAQGATQFLGLEIAMLPVGEPVLLAAGVLTAPAVIWSAVRRLRLLALGQTSGIASLYLLSHYLIFTSAYILIENINTGWLVANIWHNAQYLLFVWMYNNKRFGRTPEPQAPFLSWLARDGHGFFYFGFCLAISILIYATLTGVTGNLAAVIPALLIYQTINFHHYIVDAVIWRRRVAGSRSH